MKIYNIEIEQIIVSQNHENKASMNLYSELNPFQFLI